MMAGTTWATAPNPRVLIRISEDFVTKNTPPIPPPPAWPGAQEEKSAAAEADTPKGKEDKASSERKTAAVDQGWRPPAVHIENPNPPADPGPSGTSTTPPVKPPDIDLTRTIEIHGNRPPRTSRGPTYEQPAPALPDEPARVPSCILTGKQLVNFALRDLDNRPWEFRHRRGRLMLLDFWGTWCVPCLRTVPHLSILQDRYRQSGLEVIGIAYQRTGTPQQQREQVDAACQRLRINYKVLMGSSDCPLKTQFGIQVLPTLVLLDKNGWIVWKHEGELETEDLKDLEIQIQKWLGTR
jgi:thiol-disulfide isomerase/thioredoxin